MVPSLGVQLSNEPKLFEEVWARGTEILKLDKPKAQVAAAQAVASA
jgi:malate dehydrogenase (quinone)